MGSLAWAADWEHIVARDLAPHLVSAEDHRRVRRPAGLTGLPDGAHAALCRSVGRVDPGSLLVVPSAVWPWRRWRRSLYTPLSVAGIGQQGVGLWVRTLPTPGVRVRMPFSDIAAVEDQAGRSWRAVAVTGPPGRLLVRFHDEWWSDADGWIRLLRLRAAPMAETIPAAPGGGHRPPGWPSVDSVLLDVREGIACVCWRSRTRSSACLLALTSRELIVVLSRAEHIIPRRVIRRTLYLPRQSLQGAEGHAKTVCVRTAGTQVDFRLWSRRAAADVSSWLGTVLSSHERSDVGSWPGQQSSLLAGGLPELQRRVVGQSVAPAGAEKGELAGLHQLRLYAGFGELRSRARGRSAGRYRPDRSLGGTGLCAVLGGAHPVDHLPGVLAAIPPALAPLQHRLGGI